MRAEAFAQLSEGSSQQMFIHIPLVILTIYAGAVFLLLSRAEKG